MGVCALFIHRRTSFPPHFRVKQLQLILRGSKGGIWEYSVEGKVLESAPQTCPRFPLPQGQGTGCVNLNKSIQDLLIVSSLGCDLSLIQPPICPAKKRKFRDRLLPLLAEQLGLKFLPCLPLPAFTALRQSRLLPSQR